MLSLLALAASMITRYTFQNDPTIDMDIVINDYIKFKLSDIVVILVWALLTWCCMLSINQITNVISTVRIVAERSSPRAVFTTSFVIVIMLYDVHVIGCVYINWTVNYNGFVQVLQIFPASFLILHSFVQVHYLMNQNRNHGDAFFRIWNFLFNIIMLVHYGLFIDLSCTLHPYPSLRTLFKISIAIYELVYRITALLIYDVKMNLFKKIIATPTREIGFDNCSTSLIHSCKLPSNFITYSYPSMPYDYQTRYRPNYTLTTTEYELVNDNILTDHDHTTDISIQINSVPDDHCMGNAQFVSGVLMNLDHHQHYIIQNN